MSIDKQISIELITYDFKWKKSYFHLHRYFIHLLKCIQSCLMQISFINDRIKHSFAFICIISMLAEIAFKKKEKTFFILLLCNIHIRSHENNEFSDYFIGQRHQRCKVETYWFTKDVCDWLDAFSVIGGSQDNAYFMVRCILQR